MDAAARAPAEGLLSRTLPYHNLPPRDYERFVGRQQELAELRRLLSPRSRAYVITIDGIGGIGKSALALETAYAFRDQYAALPAAERFDAIVWVSAKRSYLTADGILERSQTFRTLNDLYAAIAQALDYPAITRVRAEEQRAIVEDVLREQRTLLLLDNLETVDDEELLAFLRELPDPTKVIVTTRHRIDVAYPVRLNGMPHDDALALIGQEAARKETALTPQEQEDLWARTGGVPLAIVWSIGLMGVGGSIASVLRRLGSGQSDIARFCFAGSVAQIRGRDAYWLLLALSLFAVDASREALGVVAGLGEDEFGRDLGLEDLLRLSLVNKEGDRFSLLPLTRSYAQSEGVAQAEWMEAARERCYRYIYDLSETHGGWSKDWKGQALIEHELTNILAVIDELSASLRYRQTDDRGAVLDVGSIEKAELLRKIMPRVARTCRIRGHWTISERLSEAAIRISRELGAHWLIGHRYWDMSRISYLRGDLDRTELLLYNAIQEWRASDDAARICRANSVLGLIALARGNIEQAAGLVTSALEDYRKLGAEYAISDLLANVGYLAERQGDLPTAKSLYNQAIVRARQADDLPRLAADTISLGRVNAASGEVAEAEARYAEGLQLAHECGRTDVIGTGLLSSAQLERVMNQPQSAVSNARQALDLFRRLGMKHEQAQAEGLLARLEPAMEGS